MGKGEQGIYGLLHTYCVPGTAVGSLYDDHIESSQLKNELDIIIISIIHIRDLRLRSQNNQITEPLSPRRWVEWQWKLQRGVCPEVILQMGLH